MNRRAVFWVAGLLAACTESTGGLTGDDASIDAGDVGPLGDDGGVTDSDGGIPPTPRCLREVTVGDGFACVLRADGEVWCWGENDRGQLGDGTRAPRPDSEPVLDANGAPLTGVIEVAAGGSHACARLETGRVLCWGLNTSGELGRGPAGGSFDVPAPVVASPRGPPIEDAAGLALGGTFTCVVRAEGRVECSGLNNTGQLGDGTTQSRAAPVPVLTDAEPQPLTGIVDLDLGAFHGCGFGASVAWCWGRSDLGQLGDGETPMDPRTAVPPALSGLDADPVVDQSVGFTHTCAVRASGELACWGLLNDFIGGLGSLFSSATPRVPTGAPTAFALARGPDATHVCVVTPDGRLSCFGRNHRGQLADGTTDGRADFEIVRFEDGRPIEGVVSAAQTQLNTCVTLDDDSVWCWGANDGGQLGQPGGGESTVPMRVDVPCPEG